MACLLYYTFEISCNAFLYLALSPEFNSVVRRAVKGFVSLQVDQRHIGDIRAMFLDALQHGACRFESLLLIVVWKDEEGLDVVREHHLGCDGRGESPLSMDDPRRCLGLRLPESREAFSSCWDLPS